MPLSRSAPRLLLALLVVFAAACGKPAESPDAPLTIYAGRSEKLIAGLIAAFEQSSGTKVEVRYGETPQLAALLLEEGGRTPADVFISQDAGALGALARAGRLAVLPPEVLAKVPDARWKSPDGVWVGTSGRARVLAHNTALAPADGLPASVRALTEPAWRGRIGWAPTNASFQSFVTALRVLDGDAAAEAWLRGVAANEPRVYKNNMAVVEALGRGEIAVGLVNHYYVHAANKDRAEPLPVANHFFAKDDPGALVNVAGVAILKGSPQEAKARAFAAFMVGPEAQAYVSRETFEYPLVPGTPAAPALRPIAEVGSPALDLSRLDTLQDTVRLLQKVEVL